MKKLLTILLVTSIIASFTTIAYSDNDISKLTGVWLYENGTTVDIIAIDKNDAQYVSFNAKTGKISAFTSYYILFDPDKADRILAMSTNEDKPKVYVWTLKDDSTLKNHGIRVFKKR